VTASELATALSLTVFALPDPAAPVKGAYAGDLLSWVMGRAQTDQAWITIMSNINIVAVASLSGVSCVILAEGVTVEADVLHAAETRGINLLGSELTAYEIACRLCEVGI